MSDRPNNVTAAPGSSRRSNSGFDSGFGSNSSSNHNDNTHNPNNANHNNTNTNNNNVNNVNHSSSPSPSLSSPSSSPSSSPASSSDNLSSDPDTQPALDARGIPTSRRVRVQMHECEELVTLFRRHVVAAYASLSPFSQTGLRVPHARPCRVFAVACRRGRPAFQIALDMRALAPPPPLRRVLLRPGDAAVWDEIAARTVDGVRGSASGRRRFVALPCGRFAVRFVRVRAADGEEVGDEEYWNA
ncbi:uncharacterized protein F4812DRAFT_465635 [Daldinia caldariorum]|uniref:uncharacterized protein n=1 Tax=Daldinia caldariorum TaxID=326644 RepID=UPI0020071EA5|nr:uncharacterized protein F4812DRAFT_465635 [Daldinia caldariorum]KAI1466279.1 hypothetical protein F4812DRAFT_465635 [Daldinia caldariorum]